MVVVVAVPETLAGDFTSLEQLNAAKQNIDNRQTENVFFIVVNFKLFIIKQAEQENGCRKLAFNIFYKLIMDFFIDNQLNTVY